MQNTLRTMLAEILANRARRRKLVAFVCVLSVLVSGGVFWQLMQPVITMTASPICGNAEHSHSSSCYANNLACGLAEDETHAHDSGCYESVQVCGEKEHSHSQSCYPAKLAEPTVAPATPEPTAVPTPEPTAVPTPEPTAEPTAEATPEPTIAPTAEATAAPTAEATSIPESTSAPDADPTMEPVPEATIESTPEATVEATIAPTLESTVEATIAPTPEATVEPTIDPSLEPTVEPTIDPSLEPTVEPSVEPTPGLPVVNIAAQAAQVFTGESAVWTYEAVDAVSITYTIRCADSVISEGALDAPSGTLAWTADVSGEWTAEISAENELGVASASAALRVVDKLELSVSCNAYSCFGGDTVSFSIHAAGGEAPVAYRISVFQDGAVLQEYDAFMDHIDVTAQSSGSVSTLALEVAATDALGNTQSTSCRIPVAVKKTEDPADWAASAKVELSGSWTEDLIRVAKTQLGYHESEINFIIRADGSAQGYTRYGDWYGMPYEEWCAMFVSFCLNYADIPQSEIPRDAGCAGWISVLKDRGLYGKSGEYMPAAGDLVFFDWDHDGHSDHVGIVSEASESSISTIEGNSSKAVRAHSYLLTDPDIMGFGMISCAYEALYPSEPEQEEEQPVIEDEPIDRNPVQLEMWAEETLEGGTLNMCAVLNGVNAESYLWQWQTAAAEDGEWENIPDTMGLECILPLTEENCSRYYRICGDYCVPLAMPALYAANVASTEEESVDDADMQEIVLDVPMPFLASAAQSPAARGIVSDTTNGSITVDVAFIDNTTGELSDIVIPYTFESSTAENALSVEAIFEQFKADGKISNATIENGEYVKALIGTSPDNIVSNAGIETNYIFYAHNASDPANCKLHFYRSNTYLIEYYFIRPGDTRFNFYDCSLYIYYTPGEPDTPQEYTVTFLDSEDGSVFDRPYTITEGETLGSLFKETDDEGNSYTYLPYPPFDGVDETLGAIWVYRDENGNEVTASINTVVNSDLTLYPKYVMQYELYLHDMDPDGEEILPEYAPDDGYIEESILVPEGDLISYYLEGKTFEDGVNAAEINHWYTEDGTAFDADSPMPASELHLYTYNYRLTLTHIEDPQNPLVITGRESMPLNEEDFVVGDTDYTTLTWTKTDKSALDLPALIAGGLTENTSARSELTLDAATGTVNFYVILDNVPRLLETRTDIKRYTFGGSRQYVSAYDLEEIYADYGFDASSIASDGDKRFAHTTHNSADLWNDVPLYRYNNAVWFIPILTHSATADVYYLPSNTKLLAGNNRNGFYSTDSFYSITVEDNLNLVYENASDIPPVQYVFNGADAQATVKAPASGMPEWEVLDKDGNVIPLTPVNNGNGTLTYTFNSVSKSYRISLARNHVRVTYDINLNPEPFDPDPSTGYVPLVNGQKVYTELWNLENGPYEILAPSLTAYHYPSTNSYSEKEQDVQEFVSWEKTSAESFNPGDTLDSPQRLYLTAKWKPIPNDNYSDNEKVDFYVIFDCSATSVASTNSKWYTDSVFATRITEGGNKGSGTIFGADNTNKLPFHSSYDDLVRTLDDTGYPAETPIYKLSEIPKDDYIFKRLRALQTEYIQEYEKVKANYASPAAYINDSSKSNKLIIVDDYTVVQPEELNASNFKLQWHVFKKEADGWHIDGHLVSRKANLTVQKTFYGDQPSIDKVKQASHGFSISVADANGNTVATLGLNDAGVKVSPDGKTYTWTLNTLTRNKAYTVRENNYIADVNKDYLTVAESIITNPSSATQNANTWMKYTDSGVTVTAISYGDNVSAYQTVNLMNSYLPETTMMIHKVNSVTGTSLSNVEFQLKDASGNVVTLYEASGVYHMEPPGDSYTTIDDGKMLTDAFGRIFLGWPETKAPGELSLTEVQAPKGYNPIGPVNFTIRETESGAIEITTTSEDAVVEDRILRIGNAPQTFNVDVQKVWLDGSDEEVEIELFRVNADGRTKVGDSAVLNADNDWQHRWENVALFDGNDPAVYEAHELRIGSTYYGADAGKDGFNAYTVTMKDMLYMDNNGNSMAGANVDGVDAYRGLLVVQNKHDTGQFEFVKYGENGAQLADAEFALYPGNHANVSVAKVNGKLALMSGNTALTPVRTVKSNSAGLVTFGTMPIGTYYMLETDAPEGYKPNLNIYQVVITDTDAQITLNGTAMLSILNERIYVDLEFTKRSAGDNSPLAGAIFGIFSDEGCTTRIRTVISNEEGLAKTNLPTGKYWMKETTAPEGYVPIDKVYTVTVNEDGSFSILDGEVKVNVILNELQVANVRVKKVDGQGAPLNGASFQIKKDDLPYLYDGTNSAFAPDSESHPDGFGLSGLTDGSYAITETHAPAGYYRITAPITFTVEAGEIMNVSCPNGVVFEDGVFTVTNVTGSMLPETGGSGTALFTAAGLALMVFSLLGGLGITVSKKKRTAR